MAVTFLTDKDPVLRYDEQTLTDEQKAQARQNIGIENLESIAGANFVRAVNHRGYCVEAPENTLSAYRLSRKKGFDCVECDVYTTSDGIPVLLHDPTVDRTSNGTGSIGEMTLAEVKALDFGSWFSSDFAGEKIPTLEEFLILCRNLGLHAYLDLRTVDAKTLVDIVKRCGMTSNVTWLGSYTTLTEVKNNDARARLALTVSDITSEVIENVNALRTGENEVIVNCEHSALTDEKVEMCITGQTPDDQELLKDVVWIPGYAQNSGFTTALSSLNAGEAYHEPSVPVEYGKTFVLTYTYHFTKDINGAGPWWSMQEQDAEGIGYKRTVLPVETPVYEDEQVKVYEYTYTPPGGAAKGIVVSGRTYAWAGNAENTLGYTQEQAKALVAETAPNVFSVVEQISEAQAVSETEDFESIPLEAWVINAESTIIGLHPYVSGVTSDSLIAWKVLRDHSIE